tara:strand:+ start:474 stop:638 length:165 start_codon:yes stop_codon:yes gene_type:complete
MKKKENKLQQKQKENRPYRMINVSFPPAKYGLIIAIIIIIIFAFYEVIKFFNLF